MAKIQRGTDKLTSAIDNAVKELDVAKTSGNYATLFRDTELVRLVSMESAALTQSDIQAYQSNTATINSLLNSVFGEEFKDAAGSLPTHSLEAAQYVTMAAADPAAYMHAQAKAKLDANLPSMNQDFLSSGSNGNLQIANSQEIATESFDEKELNKFLNYSIIYNVLASRQDEFNAGFFQPLTTTPDEVGYRVTMRLEQVWNGQEHNPNGNPEGPEYRNLIDALVHPEVLDTHSTLVIPYFQDGGPTKNDEHYLVDPGHLETTVFDLDGTAIKTAPLKIGGTHNLLGLSSHPNLIANGLMDEKDSLDSSCKVKNVYLKVGTEYVKYNTHMLYRSGFFKSVEGHMREMTLNFKCDAFLASEATKDVAGNDVAEFKALTAAGYEVRLCFHLLGTLRVDMGTVEISTLPVKIDTVFKDGKKVDISLAGRKANPTLDNLLKAVEKATIEGYDLEVHRTNYNLRTRGIMIDSTEYAEQVVIPLRSPVSIIKPIIGGDKQHPDVAALVNATRIQANNDGVLTILNLAELLEGIVSRENYDIDADRNSFPGIGRHFINPCFIREKFHLPSMINSVSSENRLKDIQGAVTTKINEIIGRILKVTNYIPVVEQMTGGNPGEIKAVIGTDYRLPQYLVTQGDARLFGGKVDYEIVRTPNKLMSNLIVMTLTRTQAEEGPDPFGFGTFVWTPELMISQQLTRGPSTFIQHMVQPRYQHIINVPILAVIEVTGIEEVTGESTVLQTTEIQQADTAKEGNALPQPEFSQKAPQGNKAGK